MHGARNGTPVPAIRKDKGSVDTGIASCPQW
jgi:hypothetical protein